MGKHSCHARQYSDQMICHKCGLVWDVNDPEPPECQREKAERKSPPPVSAKPHVVRRKSQRGYVDHSTLVFGVLLASLTVAMILLVAAIIAEGNEWNRFKVAHACKVVSHVDGSTFTTFGASTAGQAVIGFGSTPSKTGWLCDDGITYYR